jgi:hypothetical protein
MALIRPDIPDLALDTTAQAAADRLAEIKAQLDAPISVDERGGYSVKLVEANVGASTAPGQPTNSKTQLFIGPAIGKEWRVRSMRSIFTADATVGERILVFAYTSIINGDPHSVGIGDVWSGAAGTVAQASNTIEISGADQGAPGTVNLGPAHGGENLLQIVNFSWPSMWIPSEVTLRVWVFLGAGPADTFSDANFLVEERDATY